MNLFFISNILLIILNSLKLGIKFLNIQLFLSDFLNLLKISTADRLFQSTPMKTPPLRPAPDCSTVVYSLQVAPLQTILLLNAPHVESWIAVYSTADCSTLDCHATDTSIAVCWFQVAPLRITSLQTDPFQTVLLLIAPLQTVLLKFILLLIAPLQTVLLKNILLLIAPLPTVLQKFILLLIAPLLIIVVCLASG